VIVGQEDPDNSQENEQLGNQVRDRHAQIDHHAAHPGRAGYHHSPQLVNLFIGQIQLIDEGDLICQRVDLALKIFKGQAAGSGIALK